jgi:Leucine-rich repeat (LRR) protein
MRLLRVLDLEDAVGLKDEDLKTMVQRMLRLKFLSLRGCSEISRLPNSLGDLRQLQTLDVRHTSIVALPASIDKLQKLQYIRAGTKVLATTPPTSSRRLLEFRRGPGLVGVKVSRGIGKLTALHTLGVVNVGASGGNANIEELKKLTQLRKLGVSGINKHNSNKFFSETSCLVHLESLLVQLDEGCQSCLDDITLPWVNLQSLTLYGLKDMLPLGIPPLANPPLPNPPPPGNPLRKLNKLDLEIDTLQKNVMEYLGKLPELCILHLRVKQLQPENGKLHFSATMNGLELYTFKKVKILEVTCRSRLSVIFGLKSMNNLELLKIDCSIASYNMELDTRLTNLDHLSELKQVLIKGTNDEEIKTNLEDLLANHPKKPVVKLAGVPLP